MNNIFDLYLVTDRDLARGRSIINVVEDAINGGVTVVQLREKNATSLEFYNLAVELKKITSKYNVPLIINDRVDIALASDADGVHIGQSDLPFDIVKKILPKGKIIGLSIETIEHAVIANNYDLDYIAISPVFGTPTKTDTAKPLGIEGIKKIANISKHTIVGIGGINIDNIPQIINAGANGVALVSAIMSAENPFEAAKNIRNTINISKNINI